MSLPIALTTHREVYKSSLNREQEKSSRHQRVLQIRKQLQQNTIHSKRFKNDPGEILFYLKLGINVKQVKKRN